LLVSASIISRSPEPSSTGACDVRSDADAWSLPQGRWQWQYPNAVVGLASRSVSADSSARRAAAFVSRSRSGDNVSATPHGCVMRSLPNLSLADLGYTWPVVREASYAKPAVGSCIDRQKKELPRSWGFRLLTL
jgi:hypothetical protein